MAVRHLAWSFDIGLAAAAYDGLAGYSDLFAAPVTAAATRIRADPRRRPHLVMLRLDPVDEEAWAPILEPDPADSGYEVAAAGRLMLLLVGACADGEGVQAGSTDVQALLSAAGWSTDQAELAIRGRPLRTFFETHAPTLSELAIRSRSRLAGGWLDAPTAGQIKANLERDHARLEEHIAIVAAEQSSHSGLARDWHEQHLRRGLANLAPMLRQLDDGRAWWIIED